MKNKTNKVYDEAGGEVDFSFWNHTIYLLAPIILIIVAILIVTFSN